MFARRNLKKYHRIYSEMPPSLKHLETFNVFYMTRAPDNRGY